MFILSSLLLIKFFFTLLTFSISVTCDAWNCLSRVTKYAFLSHLFFLLCAKEIFGGNLNSEMPVESFLLKITIETFLRKMPIETFLRKMPFETFLRKMPIEAFLRKILFELHSLYLKLLFVLIKRLSHFECLCCGG